MRSRESNADPVTGARRLLAELPDGGEVIDIMDSRHTGYIKLASVFVMPPFDVSLIHISSDSRSLVTIDRRFDRILWYRLK